VSPYAVKEADVDLDVTMADVTEGADPGEVEALLASRNTRRDRAKWLRKRIAWLRARLAKKGLTTKQRGRLEGELAAHLSELGSATGEIRRLDETLTTLTTPEVATLATPEEATAESSGTSALLAILAEQNALLARSIGVQEAQLKALGSSYADTLSGQIGGRVGLGFQSAGVPGILAMAGSVKRG
jgi:hypothetical protein